MAKKKRGVRPPKGRTMNAVMNGKVFKVNDPRPPSPQGREKAPAKRGSVVPWKTSGGLPRTGAKRPHRLGRKPGSPNSAPRMMSKTHGATTTGHERFVAASNAFGHGNTPRRKKRPPRRKK